MKRRAIRLSARQRRWFFALGTLLFVSGAAWCWANWKADQANGDHARWFHALRSWSLKLHGAAAMGFLIAFGVLIPTHLKRAWQARRNRGNGAFFVTVIALLIISGYGLYYFGSEIWRATAVWVHLILGFAAPALLIWHIWRGRRSESS